MTGVLVSPAEHHPAIKALGTVSSWPERVGMDIWWTSGKKAQFAGGWGVQRKTVADLLASIKDGRLAIEVNQAQAVEFKVLVIEGEMRWADDGTLLSRWGSGWKRESIDSVLWGMRGEGWWVLSTADERDTAMTVARLVAWSRKAGHGALRTRGNKPKGPMFGVDAGDRETAIWVLQSVPGVGRGRAEAIVDELGVGCIGWRVGVEELCRVDGIGVRTAERMLRALGDGGQDDGGQNDGER